METSRKLEVGGITGFKYWMACGVFTRIRQADRSNVTDRWGTGLQHTDARNVIAADSRVPHAEDRVAEHLGLVTGTMANEQTLAWETRAAAGAGPRTRTDATARRRPTETKNSFSWSAVESRRNNSAFPLS